MNQEIEKILRGTAADVSPYIEKTDQERYFRFLDFMYYYTMNSGSRLDQAAEQAEERAQEYFLHMAEEETDHFKLAENDLEHFGRKPGPRKPATVADFEKFWESSNTAGRVGALLVLENISEYIKEVVTAALGRLQLPPQGCTFVMTHLGADVEHGRLTADIAEHYLKDQPEDVIAGARRAAAFWLEIHKAALQ